MKTSSVVPRQRPFERDDEGVPCGQGEKEQLGAPVAVEPHRAARPRPAHGRDRRPRHSDEQPVGSGHVRDRKAGVAAAGVHPRLPREVHVDGVFGKDGDQRHDGQRERLRDVGLGSVAGPDQQEGGAEDRGPGRDRLGRSRELEAEQPCGHAGERRGSGDRHGREPVPSGSGEKCHRGSFSQGPRFDPTGALLHRERAGGRHAASPGLFSSRRDRLRGPADRFLCQTPPLSQSVNSSSTQPAPLPRRHVRRRG